MLRLSQAAALSKAEEVALLRPLEATWAQVFGPCGCGVGFAEEGVFDMDGTKAKALGLIFVVDVVGAVDCPVAAWNFGTNSGAFAQAVVEELTGEVVAAIIAGWIWTNPPTSPERL